MSKYNAIRHDAVRLTAPNARFQGAMDNSPSGRFNELRYGTEDNKAGHEIWRRERENRMRKNQ